MTSLFLGWDAWSSPAPSLLKDFNELVKEGKRCAMRLLTE
jgi:hypothetical protein